MRTWRSLPFLTAADAVVTPAAGDGGGAASPPPACSALRARLPRCDADVHLSRSARLLPRRLPPLPTPSGHPPVPPRRRGLLVRRRISRGFPLLPQANRTRNHLPPSQSSSPSPRGGGCCLTWFLWPQWGISSGGGAAWPVANPVVTCADVEGVGFPSSFVANPFLFIQVFRALLAFLVLSLCREEFTMQIRDKYTKGVASCINFMMF